MFRKTISIIVLIAFTCLSIVPPGQAQGAPTLHLPTPGTMVGMSPAHVPVLLKGMTLHPDDPFRFDFIVDSGHNDSSDPEIKAESERLVKYFLAAMTTSQDDLWVNLSPNEPDRIVPESLSKTELGRDLLAQDYLLKQLTASLMYPEDKLGAKFWNKIFSEVKAKYGNIDIPTETFHKVWILPESATVYEHANTVYVVDAKLKVMMENEYLATANTPETQAMKETILPAIEHEVNNGENFAPLRQIYHSLILAKWYKQTVKNSLLSKVYIDQNKVGGVDNVDQTQKDEIYARYMKAYKQGVYDFMKEEYDAAAQDIIPRHYFSGGFTDSAMNMKTTNARAAIDAARVGREFDMAMTLEPQGTDAAMIAIKPLTRARNFIDKVINQGKIKNDRQKAKLLTAIDTLHKKYKKLNIDDRRRLNQLLELGEHDIPDKVQAILNTSKFDAKIKKKNRALQGTLIVVVGLIIIGIISSYFIFSETGVSSAKKVENIRRELQTGESTYSKNLNEEIDKTKILPNVRLSLSDQKHLERIDELLKEFKNLESNEQLYNSMNHLQELATYINNNAPKEVEDKFYSILIPAVQSILANTTFSPAQKRAAILQLIYFGSFLSKDILKEAPINESKAKNRIKFLEDLLKLNNSLNSSEKFLGSNQSRGIQSHINELKDALGKNASPAMTAPDAAMGNDKNKRPSTHKRKMSKGNVIFLSIVAVALVVNLVYSIWDTLKYVEDSRKLFPSNASTPFDKIAWDAIMQRPSGLNLIVSLFILIIIPLVLFFSLRKGDNGKFYKSIQDKANLSDSDKAMTSDMAMTLEPQGMDAAMRSDAEKSDDATINDAPSGRTVFLLIIGFILLTAVPAFIIIGSNNKGKVEKTESPAEKLPSHTPEPLDPWEEFDKAYGRALESSDESLKRMTERLSQESKKSSEEAPKKQEENQEPSSSAMTPDAAMSADSIANVHSDNYIFGAIFIVAAFILPIASIMLLAKLSGQFTPNQNKLSHARNIIKNLDKSKPAAIQSALETLLQFGNKNDHELIRASQYIREIFVQSLIFFDSNQSIPSEGRSTWVDPQHPEQFLQEVKDEYPDAHKVDYEIKLPERYRWSKPNSAITASDAAMLGVMITLNDARKFIDKIINQGEIKNDGQKARLLTAIEIFHKKYKKLNVDDHQRLNQLLELGEHEIPDKVQAILNTSKFDAKIKKKNRALRGTAYVILSVLALAVIIQLARLNEWFADNETKINNLLGEIVTGQSTFSRNLYYDTQSVRHWSEKNFKVETPLIDIPPSLSNAERIKKIKEVYRRLKKIKRGSDIIRLVKETELGITTAAITDDKDKDVQAAFYDMLYQFIASTLNGTNSEKENIALSIVMHEFYNFTHPYTIFPNDNHDTTAETTFLRNILKLDAQTPFLKEGQKYELEKMLRILESIKRPMTLDDWRTFFELIYAYEKEIQSQSLEDEWQRIFNAGGTSIFISESLAVDFGHFIFFGSAAPTREGAAVTNLKERNALLKKLFTLKPLKNPEIIHPGFYLYGTNPPSGFTSYSLPPPTRSRLDFYDGEVFQNYLLTPSYTAPKLPTENELKQLLSGASPAMTTSDAAMNTSTFIRRTFALSHNAPFNVSSIDEMTKVITSLAASHWFLSGQSGTIYLSISTLDGQDVEGMPVDYLSDGELKRHIALPLDIQTITGPIFSGRTFEFEFVNNHIHFNEIKTSGKRLPISNDRAQEIDFDPTQIFFHTEVDFSVLLRFAETGQAFPNEWRNLRVSADEVDIVISEIEHRLRIMELSSIVVKVDQENNAIIFEKDGWRIMNEPKEIIVVDHHLSLLIAHRFPRVPFGGTRFAELFDDLMANHVVEYDLGVSSKNGHPLSLIVQLRTLFDRPHSSIVFSAVEGRDNRYTPYRSDVTTWSKYGYQHGESIKYHRDIWLVRGLEEPSPHEDERLTRTLVALNELYDISGGKTHKDVEFLIAYTDQLTPAAIEFVAQDTRKRFVEGKDEWLEVSVEENRIAIRLTSEAYEQIRPDNIEAAKHAISKILEHAPEVIRKNVLKELTQQAAPSAAAMTAPDAAMIDEADEDTRDTTPILNLPAPVMAIIVLTAFVLPLILLTSQLSNPGEKDGNIAEVNDTENATYTSLTTPQKSFNDLLKMIDNGDFDNKELEDVVDYLKSYVIKPHNISKERNAKFTSQIVGTFLVRQAEIVYRPKINTYFKKYRSGDFNPNDPVDVQTFKDELERLRVSTKYKKIKSAYLNDDVIQTLKEAEDIFTQYALNLMRNDSNAKNPDAAMSHIPRWTQVDGNSPAARHGTVKGRAAYVHIDASKALDEIMAKALYDTIKKKNAKHPDTPIEVFILNDPHLLNFYAEFALLLENDPIPLDNLHIYQYDRDKAFLRPFRFYGLKLKNIKLVEELTPGQPLDIIITEITKAPATHNIRLQVPESVRPTAEQILVHFKNPEYFSFIEEAFFKDQLRKENKLGDVTQNIPTATFLVPAEIVPEDSPFRTKLIHIIPEEDVSPAMTAPDAAMTSSRRIFLTISTLAVGLGLLPLAAQEKPKKINPTFEPKGNKVLLVVGQNNEMVNEYANEVGVPGGLMTYTNLRTVEGLFKSHKTKYGTYHAQDLLKRYPNSAIQLGVHLKGALADVNNKSLDGNIAKLAKWIKQAKRPVYLRLGYEFDGRHNEYTPEEYKKAYRHITDTLRNTHGVTNATFVWHTIAWDDTGWKKDHLDNWYPGDEYVDWIGISFFDVDRKAERNTAVAFAKDKKKPLMIAESTPHLYKTLEDKKRWFRGLFKFIKTADVKVLSYINTNWPNYEGPPGWGDSRVQQHPELKTFWQEQTPTSTFLHSDDHLLKNLGHTPDPAMSPDAAMVITLSETEKEGINLTRGVINHLDTNLVSVPGGDIYDLSANNEEEHLTLHLRDGELRIGQIPENEWDTFVSWENSSKPTFLNGLRVERVIIYDDYTILLEVTDTNGQLILIFPDWDFTRGIDPKRFDDFDLSLGENVYEDENGRIRKGIIMTKRLEVPDNRSIHVPKGYKAPPYDYERLRLKKVSQGVKQEKNALRIVGRHALWDNLARGLSKRMKLGDKYTVQFLGYRHFSNHSGTFLRGGYSHDPDSRFAQAQRLVDNKDPIKRLENAMDELYPTPSRRFSSPFFETFHTEGDESVFLVTIEQKISESNVAYRSDLGKDGRIVYTKMLLGPNPSEFNIVIEYIGEEHDIDSQKSIAAREVTKTRPAAIRAAMALPLILTFNILFSLGKLTRKKHGLTDPAMSPDAAMTTFGIEQTVMLDAVTSFMKKTEADKQEVEPLKRQSSIETHKAPPQKTDVIGIFQTHRYAKDGQAIRPILDHIAHIAREKERPVVYIMEQAGGNMPMVYDVISQFQSVAAMDRIKDFLSDIYNVNTNSDILRMIYRQYYPPLAEEGKIQELPLLTDEQSVAFQSYRNENIRFVNDHNNVYAVEEKMSLRAWILDVKHSILSAFLRHDFPSDSTFQIIARGFYPGVTHLPEEKILRDSITNYRKYMLERDKGKNLENQLDEINEEFSNPIVITILGALHYPRLDNLSPDRFRSLRFVENIPGYSQNRGPEYFTVLEWLRLRHLADPSKILSESDLSLYQRTNDLVLRLNAATENMGITSAKEYFEAAANVIRRFWNEEDLEKLRDGVEVENAQPITVSNAMTAPDAAMSAKLFERLNIASSTFIGFEVATLIHLLISLFLLSISDTKSQSAAPLQVPLSSELADATPKTSPAMTSDGAMATEPDKQVVTALTYLKYIALSIFTIGLYNAYFSIRIKRRVNRFLLEQNVAPSFNKGLRLIGSLRLKGFAERLKSFRQHEDASYIELLEQTLKLLDSPPLPEHKKLKLLYRELLVIEGSKRKRSANPTRFQDLAYEIRRLQEKIYTDSAMSPGGIDMKEINLQRKGDGITMEFDPAMVAPLLNDQFRGFKPVTIHFAPLPSIMPILGFEDTPTDEPPVEITQAEAHYAREVQFSF